MHLWGNTFLLLIILNDYSAASSLCIIAESPDYNVTSFAAPKNKKLKKEKKLSIHMKVTTSRQIIMYANMVLILQVKKLQNQLRSFILLHYSMKFTASNFSLSSLKNTCPHSLQFDTKQKHIEKE